MLMKHNLMRVQYFVLIVFLLALTATPVYADNYQDGLDAANKGEYNVAYKNFRSSAEHGHARAQTSLGVLFYHGLGRAQDYKEALKWFKLAAEQGEAVAQNNLGLMYFEGHGVVQNHGVGIKWYKLSAEQGYAMAQYKLGFSYLKGQGVFKNNKKAAKWYRKAAEQGNAQAQFDLGNMYVEGRGVSSNYEKALKWFRLSAEQGNADAFKAFGVLEELMKEEKKEYQKGQAHSSDGDWGTTWPKKVDLSGAVNDLRYNEKKFFISCVSGSHGKMEDLGIVSIGDKLYAEKYSFQVGIIEMTKLPKDLKSGNKIFARKGQTICVIAKNKNSLPQEDDCDALWISSIGCKSVP
jgi:TPR repeat protein